MRITTSSCPSIGLLLDILATGYQRDLIEGVARATAGRAANLLVFVGGWFWDESLSTEANVLYRHVGKPALDGVVVATSTLINRIGAEPGRRIIRGFDLPSVSVGLPVDGVPSVMADNRTGLYELCRHLVEDHGYRELAMIAGPEYNDESQERVQACKRALAKLGVKLDDERVTHQGFLISSGKQGVHELVTARGLRLEGLDAILCASDLIAEGALSALKERGLRVPDDVALTGFDDLDRARYLIPPLSTVRQSVVNLGLNAGRVLLQSLDGVDAPPSIVLPSETILRRSCGCQGASVTALRLSRAPENRSSRNPAAALTLLRRHDVICAVLSRAAQGRFATGDAGWESRWVMGLFSDLGDPRETGFLAQLEGTLRALASRRTELELCQELLGVLRQEALTALDDAGASRRLEDIMHSARLMTSAALERLEVSRRLETTEALQGALFGVARLARAVGQEDFWQQLERELLALGIHTAFVTRYDAEAPERSSYVFGFSALAPLPQLQGTEFPTVALLPKDLLRRPRDYGILVQCLVYGGRAIGTLLLSLTAKEIGCYAPFASLVAVELAGGGGRLGFGVLRSLPGLVEAGTAGAGS